VDTGGWIALAVQRDRLHAAAAAYARRLAEVRAPLLTTNYVLLEAYTRIRYDDGHNRAIEFDSAIADLQAARRLTIAWVSAGQHARALEIFRKYSDQLFSIVDCASFVIARDRKVREVFGFDRGFLTMGFLLKPGISG
jgi:predicted nucleic acid-binding protein